MEEVQEGRDNKQYRQECIERTQEGGVGRYNKAEPNTLLQTQSIDLTTYPDGVYSAGASLVFTLHFSNNNSIIIPSPLALAVVDTDSSMQYPPTSLISPHLSCLLTPLLWIKFTCLF